MRRIMSAQFQASGTAVAPDGFGDRVVKYIPAEVLAAWVAASGIIPSVAAQRQLATFWVAFVLGVVFTAAWTWRQTRLPNQKTAVTQIVLSTIAFVIWAYAMGGPFSLSGVYDPAIGSLLLIFYTLAVGFVVPQE